MVKKDVHAFWLRNVIPLVLWQAALLALAWLLSSQVQWLYGYNLSDSLFMVGLLQVAIGGAALMRSPVDETSSVWQRMWMRTNALPDERDQILLDFARKESFFIRLATSGVLTILISMFASFFG